MKDAFKLVGTTIAGKYRVDRVVGEGGLGIVYAGMHLVLGAPVAIKCLKPFGGSLEDESRLTELFLREARVLFSLTHPGIVRMFDAGNLTHPVPVPYVVLELIDGDTLEVEIASRARSSPPRSFSAPELLAIFEPVLEAVAFAHREGIAHRDLKPGNVMLIRTPQGGVSAKVVDFGIARRILDPRHTAASTGFTPRYAAPEQWDPSIGRTGGATDVFALGLMLAEACTLKAALSATGVAEIFTQLMSPTRRISVGPQRPDLPTAIDEVIDRATRVHPSERFPSAHEMSIALRAALTAPVMPVVNVTPSVAPSFTPPAPKSLPSAASTSRAPLVLSFVIVLLVVGGLSAAVVFMMVDRRDARPAGKAENGARATAGDEEGAAHPSSKKVGKYSVVLESVMALDDDLSQAQIMEVLDAHVDEVKECYRKAIEREPGLKGGTLGVLLTANAAGKVTESQVAEDTVGDTPMQLCITAKASGWKFPKSSTGSMGDTFTATWRFKR